MARRTVEVIRIADGAIEASLALDGAGVATPDSPTTPHALMYSGSWSGDRVVANSDVGVVVLNVRDGLRIESVMATPAFANGIAEPVFAGDATILGWANIGVGAGAGKKDEPAYNQALVECTLASKSCSVGAPSPARSWNRWISNPSR